MAQGRYDLEEQRLAALYDYDVLDTEPEETFDRITRLVRLATGTSMARVSFVDQDREWFKSRNGSEAKEGCRSHSFCTHTIESDGPLVVPDTLTDPRFADHPLVACKVSDSMSASLSRHRAVLTSVPSALSTRSRVKSRESKWRP